jgi:hypothetical protein
MIGAALGVLLARMWGLRARWLLASVLGVGGGYLLIWAIGRLSG